MMEPVGLTFKKEGVDKYGKERQGEIMLIHQCEKCGKVNINRLAGDDQTEEVMSLFENSKDRKFEDPKDIEILKEEDREEVRAQLFGRGWRLQGQALQVLFDEGEGDAAFAGTASSTDAVNIVFISSGEIKINDVTDIGDVETTRSNVGRQ